MPNDLDKFAGLVRPRIYFNNDLSLGPEKIELLKTVSETQSISAAAKKIGMSYRKAWLLISSLNDGFSSPVVTTVTGGKSGGGTTVTPLGIRLIECYERLEKRLLDESKQERAELHKLLNTKS